LGGLVNVVLHESVHATVYIPGQAYFNESVASYVADQLTAEYLKSRSQEFEAYFKNEKEGQKRQERLHQTYERLDALYRSDRSEAEKLAQKDKILSEVKQELGFRREINNATLIQYKAYSTGTSDFEALWKACGRDGRRFMATVRKLKKESFKKPQQEDLSSVLQPLIQAGCGN
jgi:predicted aminopeptidase